MTPGSKIRRIKISLVIAITILTVILITYLNDNTEKEKNVDETISRARSRPNDKMTKIIKRSNGTTRLDRRPETKATTKDTPRNNRWIKISNDVRVYSAFWDARTTPSGRATGNLVRILAVGLRNKLKMAKSLPQIYCYFKYTNGSVRQSSHVTVVELGETHEAFYVSQFLNCLHPNSTDIPNYTGIATLGGSLPKNWLKIEKHFEKEIRKIVEDKNATELAVCVRPLYGPYDKILQMAEFIAFYSLLGVNRFIFYQYSVSRNVREFWKILMQDGLDIRLYRWNLSDAAANAWAIGQTASIQHCIYSSASHSDYVLFADLDEFVLPRKNITLMELINSYPRNASGLLFRQALFCLEFKSTYPSNVDVKTSRMLLTQFKTKRLKNVSPAGYRSKYLVKPNEVLYAGIHDVIRYLERRHRTTVVSLDDAMTQHYRDDTVPCLSANQDDIITDLNARRYAKFLYQSNIFKYEVIKNKLIF